MNQILRSSFIINRIVRLNCRLFSRQRNSSSINLIDAKENSPIKSNENIRNEILSDILDLYRLNPNEKYFRHYSFDAQFEDPIQFSGNLKSIKSAFKSLPYLFRSTEVVPIEINLQINPIKIIIETKYQWKFLNIETTIRSVVLLTLNQSEKIIRHEERWNGDLIPNSKSGFIGSIKQLLRHLMGHLVHVIVDSEKPFNKK